MIDLHVHTTESDGRLSVQEVLAEAAARDLRAIAITDHDVVAAVPPALASGTTEVVAGIEMTARWQGTRAVHVLGYFIDPNDAALNAALAGARERMGQHVDAVLREVRAAGGRLDREHLQRYRTRYAGGAALVLGMLDQGVLRGAPTGTGLRLLRLAAAEPRLYSVGEAVRLIHGAGGVASLAHPARLQRGRPLLAARDLEPLARQGLDAIEAWQWIPNGWGSEHYQGVARELGLSVSGGSDDHGQRTADGHLRLGSQPVPDDVLESLRERAFERRRR